MRAIADAGYVALAPIREFNSDSARFERTAGRSAPRWLWDGAIEGGIRSVHAARAYLTASARVTTGQDCRHRFLRRREYYLVVSAGER